VLDELPPALRALAALALTGHTRREIAYLLGLSDTALRQRVMALKRHLVARGVAMPAGMPGLKFELAYGRVRDALLPVLVRQGGTFASHDPDGHLFVVRRPHQPLTE
jgi:RNA polymerase sigma-70 factor (ECF subfamily)